MGPVGSVNNPHFQWPTAPLPFTRSNRFYEAISLWQQTARQSERSLPQHHQILPEVISGEGGAAFGGIVAGLSHIRQRVQLNNHVKAVRGFLEDSGFSKSMVQNDVVLNRDTFWNKYYAKFVGDISDYGSFFSGGNLDSYSKTSDAYVSMSKKLFIRGNSIFSDELALKYYPSRGNSIGLIRVCLENKEGMI